MTTRYSSLVSVKKNIMQKSERAVQTANAVLQNANKALQDSYDELDRIKTPEQGIIKDFLSIRSLLDSQRAMIRHNEEWVDFAEKELSVAKEQLKKTMIEFEKFQYLEFQEIKKELAKQKYKEVKDLDEIALIGHTRKDTTKVA